MERWLPKIKRLGACYEAVIWARDYDSLDEAWQACERGDWMLWLAGKLSGEPGSEKRKILVLAACECARLSLPYVLGGESRPLTAIETTEAWARGDDGVTLEQVRAAADAAYAAARLQTLRSCADIVRKYYPAAPEVE